MNKKDNENTIHRFSTHYLLSLLVKFSHLYSNIKRLHHISNVLWLCWVEKKKPEMSKTAPWRSKVRQMALQQSSQINMTSKKKRASLGKGYRTVAAASCVLGQRMMCQCGQPWPPHPLLKVKQWSGYSHVLGGLLCHHSEMELALRANKISLHL